MVNGVMSSELTILLREEANYIWERIFEHPFVIELYTGILPVEKFKYYLLQDYSYLITMAKCFALIAAKADYEVARTSLELAYLDATTEMANYEKLLEKLGLNIEDAVRTEPSPTNTAYMNFLLSTCALADPIEALIALLPCFWSYMEIAERHREKLRDNKNDLYVKWAQVYLSKEYLNIVEKLKRIINYNASRVNYNVARRLFITASKFEYLFWDMAYKMEKWPL